MAVPVVRGKPSRRLWEASRLGGCGRRALSATERRKPSPASGWPPRCVPRNSTHPTIGGALGANDESLHARGLSPGTSGRAHDPTYRARVHGRGGSPPREKTGAGPEDFLLSQRRPGSRSDRDRRALVDPAPAPKDVAKKKQKRGILSPCFITTLFDALVIFGEVSRI